MTNVDEEQSDCSEEVGEGDEAEVMEDLLLVLQRPCHKGLPVWIA